MKQCIVGSNIYFILIHQQHSFNTHFFCTGPKVLGWGIKKLQIVEKLSLLVLFDYFFLQSVILWNQLAAFSKNVDPEMKALKILKGQVLGIEDN